MDIAAAIMGRGNQCTDPSIIITTVIGTMIMMATGIVDIIIGIDSKGLAGRFLSGWRDVKESAGFRRFSEGLPGHASMQRFRFR